MTDQYGVLPESGVFIDIVFIICNCNSQFVFVFISDI